MSPRAHVYAALAAVLLAVPVAGHALTVSVTLTPKNADGSVNGAASVVATCTAASFGMGGSYTSGSATVTGGTFAGNATTVPLSTAVSTLPVSTAASGTLTVSCTAIANNPFSGTTTVTGAAVATILPPPAAAPEISALSPEQATVLVGTAQPVSVTATDPGALALTYAWTATGGTFAAPAAAATVWSAPATQGSYTLTVTVTNSAGQSASRSALVNTALSVFQSSLSAPMSYPRRVAAAPGGELFVVDDLGVLHLLTKRGDLKNSLATLGATAVAVAPDGVYVATTGRGIVKIDGATGRVLGTIPWGASSVISGLAWDPGQKLLWAANFENRRAIAFRQDGTLAFTITTAEGRALRAVADVAVDAATNTLWVAEKDGMTGKRVHAFSTADASYSRSMVTAGLGAGQVIDTGGIALDGAGRVFVSDAFGGTVQVMSTAGAFVGTIGTKGDTDGYLLQPRGLAFMANGDLAIANSWFNRIDRFGTGAALPTCQAGGQPDSDCDGLPDAWELANGFNPNDASDALLDSDGDGLTNLEEFALGTNPRNADTDGDGYSDRDELLAGFNPLDPNDHRPALAVGAPITMPPGIAKLNATGTGPGTCVAAWRQVAGPTVSLRNADTFTPSFVARKDGTYKFEGIARCGTASSAPAVAEVTVLNVAPIADAGSQVVTEPGRTVTLSAAYSSDANGDPLTFAWEQVAGPVTSIASRGKSLTVRPAREGYYAFKLTATDTAGAIGEAFVTVVAVDDDLPTAIVVNPLVAAVVGVPVTLDASPSVPQGVTFSWVELGGASALPAVAAPAFTPPAAGLYVFEVTAWKEGLRSPPARVIVLAAAGAALPTAIATAPLTSPVNAAVTLDGSASAAAGGGALGYLWRQVAGPAAGIVGADGAVATVVPFSTGAYAFELTVAEAGGAVSAPALVRFDVTASGKALPVARGSAPATAQLDELVMLDGRASTGGKVYRWTQVSGPWVALDGSSAVSVFRASAAGLYRFELVVEDGTVRSAPATVTVNVQ